MRKNMKTNSNFGIYDFSDFAEESNQNPQPAQAGTVGNISDLILATTGLGGKRCLKYTN